MNIHHPSFHLLLATWVLGLPACKVDKTTAPEPSAAETPQATPASSSKAAEPKKEEARSVAEAQIVVSSNQARRLELKDAGKKTIATFYPGFFTQKLWVPDVEGNSGGLIEATVTGSDVLAAKVDPSSGRVLVAVRGFIYAEVSTDLLFVIETNDPASKPTDQKNIHPVYFDGPTHLRPNVDNSKSARRSFHDITEVGFGEAGELLVVINDASGGTCQLTYNREAAPLSCRWSGGESRICPHGL
jgi:hypothetical protein